MYEYVQRMRDVERTQDMDDVADLATEKLNESLAQICKGIGINPVQLPPALAAGPSMDVTQNN